MDELIFKKTNSILKQLVLNDKIFHPDSPSSTPNQLGLQN